MRLTSSQSLVLSFVALVIMMVLFGLTSAELLGPNPVGQTGNYVDPLIIPAGYAFSIWGIIYLGLIVFPIYQLIRKDRHSIQWIRVRVWYSANVVANGLWLVCASYDWFWITVFIIILMLVSLVKICTILAEEFDEDDPKNYWTEHLVFSLYFAWITLATVLNVSSALAYYGWDGFGISDEQWTLIMLTAAAAIAISVFWKFRDIAYGLVVIWAYSALIVRHFYDYPTIAYLCMVVIALFVFAIFLAIRGESRARQ